MPERTMTAVFKKLNYKSQDPILVIGAPESFEAELRAMPGELKAHRAPAPGVRYAFALAFAPMKADLVKSAKSVLHAIEDEAVLWFAYPKQTSKRYRSDLRAAAGIELRSFIYSTKSRQQSSNRLTPVGTNWSRTALCFVPDGGV